MSVLATRAGTFGFVASSWIALVACAGCRSVGGVEDGGLLPSGLVYGRVTSTGGAPVVGVSVAPNVYSDSTECQEGRGGLSGGIAAITDSLGRYRKVVTSPLLPASYCVSVRILPPPGGTAPSGVTVGATRLKLDLVQNGRRIDSLRVDVGVP